MWIWMNLPNQVIAKSMVILFIKRTKIDFADTKFSECQKSFKYQLKDSKKADFFKFLLKQMLAHKGKENEWVPFAEIEGEDEFDDDDLMELVHEGMIDKLDHKIRFRTNKIYNSVLKYYN